MAQSDASVLAQLIAQAAAGGAAEPAERNARGGADATAWRAIVEEAGMLGATRALARLGLEDARAAADMAELRELLAAWRDAKRSLWKAVLGWAAKTLLVVVLAGLAVKLGFWELVR